VIIADNELFWARMLFVRAGLVATLENSKLLDLKSLLKVCDLQVQDLLNNEEPSQKMHVLFQEHFVW
jgi:hypothetical protein